METFSRGDIADTEQAAPVPRDGEMAAKGVGIAGRTTGLAPCSPAAADGGICTREILPQPSRSRAAVEHGVPKDGQALTSKDVRALEEQFSRQPTEEILAWAWKRYRARAAIGTSFQGAGLVMIHLAKRNQLPLPVFTLDTGLLFPETVALKKRLEDFFEIAIESLVPDLTLEEQANIDGPELWKRNPDLCCTIRKVLPLRDKLCDLDCWLTGVRREQSDARARVGILELYVFDAASGRDIVKLNPMANWSRQAVWNYLREHKIPYNPLADQGYRSIGCAPCTVKTGKGENERAGRWTGFNKVECGIHTFMPKKVDFQI